MHAVQFMTEGQFMRRQAQFIVENIVINALVLTYLEQPM